MSHGVPIPMLAIATEGKQRGRGNGKGGNRAKGTMQDILRLNQHIKRARLIILIGETESSSNQFEAVGEGDALQCARLYSRLVSLYHRNAAICFSLKLSLIDYSSIIRDEGANGEHGFRIEIDSEESEQDQRAAYRYSLTGPACITGLPSLLTLLKGGPYDAPIVKLITVTYFI